MFFAADDVGILHYTNEKRYGTVDKSKKIVKLLELDDILVVREHVIESWKEGNCEKSCTLDHAIIDAYIYNNRIIVIQRKSIIIMNKTDLKIESTIDGDFDDYIQFDQGHIFLGGSGLKILSLGEVENLEAITTFSVPKPIFKSKQKKNAYNGVDELNYRCAFITSPTTFLATSKYNIHFFDMMHGQRPVEIIPFGDSAFSQCVRVNDTEMLLSDVVGEVYLYDYVKKVQLRKYMDRESRSCATHFSISGDNLFIAYLDRHVRHFNINTRELIGKVFLKNKLTCVLAEKVPEETDEDIWNEIPETVQKTKLSLPYEEDLECPPLKKQKFE